ncbi:hypothetical protein Tsubulata_012953 [Turnera subulata]|uniref:WPP domain-containing protein n=1 Tax=Turnera subulata TaxID=218843 RepID=A0A9Q0GFG8_9ROSI|nr:hypothetical protein Tsubulata_012953 [Turnera subulata]
MDLKSETPAPQSIQDNGLTTSNLTREDDENIVKANGSPANEISYVGSTGNVDLSASPSIPVAGGVGSEEVGDSVNSQPVTAKSPAAKGFGLKRWRRIRRDVVKETTANSDSSKALKRVLPSAVNPSKSTHLSPVEIKQDSEQGSVGSVNMIKSNAVVADGFANRGSSLESRLVAAPVFAAGTDSENSEDHSSKSSTAASAPRMRYDLPAVAGYAHQMNRTKILNGNGVGSSAQRVQQGKGHPEVSKKPRGEKVKIEKENSHSSMESDSRSSNFVFMQGNYSVTSNGKQGGASMNYDGENSDDANAVEQPFGEEVHPGFSQENVGEGEDVSEDGFVAEASWKSKEGKSENHQPATDEDPLLESILTLQSVQEALENEVQKLGEIGKVSMPEGSSSSDPGVHESSSPVQLDSDNIMQSTLMESEVLSLTENIKHLESSLEEANALLKVRESRVAVLEDTLNNSLKGESGNISELDQEKCRELEVELETLFKQKIEAEIECLTLTRTIQKLRVATGDEITLFEQQEALAGEQIQMLNKLGQAESKVATLRKRADKLEEYRGDFLETEEILKMQGRVCHITSCFFVQLILLILVFWLVVSELSPPAAVVVPT